MRRPRAALTQQLLALLTAGALLSPGPALAQTVLQGANVQVPSGTSGAVGAVPSGLAHAPVGAPGASLTRSALIPVAGVSETLALPGGISPARKASPAAAGAATALPLAGSARPSSKGGIGLVAQALAGVREAATLLPVVGHLAAPAKGPDAHASLDEQRAQADAQFAAKLGFDAEDADPTDFEPWATVPGWAKTPGDSGSGRGGRGGGKKAGKPEEEPLPDPKYGSRPIKLNDATLPSVAMRPDRPVSPLVVQAIDATRRDLLVAAYEFKDREILKALRRARDRGVKIQIVLDYDNVFPRRRAGEKYRPHRSLEIQSLLNEGFDVKILRGMWKYGIMHNKYMVFDGKVAEWGSYNYSWTAEGHHFENANFTDDKVHVGGFTSFFRYLRERAVSYEQARAHEWPTETGPPPFDESLSVAFKNKDGKTVRLPKFFFNPNPKSEDWVVEALDAAAESIDFNAFTFRSTKIAEALVRAKERGIKVRVILDKSQNDQDATKPFRDYLAFHGVKVRILAGPDPKGPEWAQKDHNKFFIVDGKLVETGSMNFTKNAAIFNYENGAFLTDKTDVASYVAFFGDMWKNRNSKAAEKPASAPEIPTDEQLIEELKTAPDPEPPPPEWAPLPEAQKLSFNGEVFPAYVMRPHHPTQSYLSQAIRSSKKSIQIAIYEFTLPEILDALREAKKKPGMKIEIVMDYMHVYPRGNDHTGKPRQRSKEIQALMDEGFD
ncbi:MAG: DUF1669 domain-containing protein, partial [Elusimicrobia bacterium]|nr:DUF1669 domain-containing protein [Elusimicrobiota bacterium]